MTAKRILLLDTGKEWGGGTNSMLELLRRIDQRRFAVTALFYRNYRKGDHSTLEAELAAVGVPLRLLPPAAPPWWEKPLKELARLLAFWSRPWRMRLILAIERRSRAEPQARRIAAVIREGRFQLLYMNNQPASNVEGYLAAALAGVPAVQHCRIEPVLTPPLADLVNSHAARVICVSEGVRDVLVDAGVSADRCITVHNGIDCRQALPTGDGIRAGWPFPEGAVIIGTVGRLAPIKRTGDLIEALALARQRRPELDLRLVVVGEGAERQRLQQLVAARGLAERVHFTGFAPRPLPLVAAVDIFALVSAAEGLPRVILEAMLLARPVVASAVVGSREVVAYGETGLLFPCGDLPALAEALIRLAADAGLRRRLGANGRERVAREFSIERYVAGVETQLEALG